ncbi:MAG: SCP2 sterol-binding domain-containing protein [Pseudomonadales bacterium]|nr:SCP2 sterol-binding domain-containing protein [Pseudomonadales bacterium]
MAPSLLDAFAASVLDATLVGLLRTDPATAAELRAMGSGRLHLALERPALALTLVLSEAGTRIEAGDAETADASVHLTPAAVAAFLSGDAEGAVLAGDARITGDTQLAERAFAALARFRPDFAAPLARVLGDAPVAAASTAAREGRTFVRDTVTRSRERTRDWLTGESGLLPSRPEVSRFLDEVDDARLATDRLEARIRRLAARVAPAAPADAETSAPDGTA